MFIFDILTREDRRLRAIALCMAAGLFVLLSGLWFVQIVCASQFENNSRKQSLKRVGMPAIRGKILDCKGQVLADNRPQYNAVLYLEGLQSMFGETYNRLGKAYGSDPSAGRAAQRPRSLDRLCQPPTATGGRLPGREQYHLSSQRILAGTENVQPGRVFAALHQLSLRSF